MSYWSRQGPLVTTGHDLCLDHGRRLIRVDSGDLSNPMTNPMPEIISDWLFTPASKFVRMLGPCVLAG
jgi:hypothetical protein